MKDQIKISVQQAILSANKLMESDSLAFIENAACLIADCYKNGGKIIIAGNGGSLCDAMHFAEEMTGFFRHRRQALPAISLSEPGHITCVGNDIGFEWVFSRGIEAYGKENDIFIGLTTSGNSKNLVNAFKKAAGLGLKTIAFLGKSGGALKGYADLELIIDDFMFSDRIQEAHMAAIHIIIEMVERLLFSSICPKNEEALSAH